MEPPEEAPAGGSRSAAPAERAPLAEIALSCAEAALLLAAYSLGYPWFYRWSAPWVAGMRGAQVAQEAGTLLGVGVLVALLGIRRVRAAAGPSGATLLRRGGIEAASATLLALALLGLALRLFDPSFDRTEFAAYGLADPAELRGFLALLPFGVAAEELIFRGFQKRLGRAFGHGSATVAAGAAFALFHWVPGTALDRHEIESLAATFAGGLVLALCYRALPSVPLLIGVHLIYDYLALAQGWLNVAGRRGEEALLFALWIAGSAILALSAIRRRRRDAAAGPPPSASPPGPALRAAGWLAAPAFGVGLPLLLAWIRLRLGL